MIGGNPFIFIYGEYRLYWSDKFKLRYMNSLRKIITETSGEYMPDLDEEENTTT